MVLSTYRRYLLAAALNKLEEDEADVALDIVNKRAAQTKTNIPARCPSKKKLLMLVSEEFKEVWEINVFLYECLEDLQGATTEELTDLGLTEEEAQKVVNFIEEL